MRTGTHIFLILCIFFLLTVQTLVVKGEKEKTESKSTNIIDSLSNETKPSLIRTDDGYMLAYISDINGTNDIWIISSKDGLKWNNPIQATNNISEEWNPSLIKTKDKYFIYYDYLSKWSFYPGVWMVNSTDGINWNQTKRIINETEFGNGSEGFMLMHNPNTIELNNGSYMMINVKILRLCMEEHKFLAVNYSNNGVNWNESIQVSEFYNSYKEEASYYSTPSLIQLKNNSFMIVFTYGLKNKSVIYTSNNSINWTKPIKYSNGDHPSLIQLENETLLIVNSEGIFTSLNGITWNQTSNKTYFEPSVVQYSDNEIMIAHVVNESGNNNIWIEIRKPYDEIDNGENYHENGNENDTNDDNNQNPSSKSSDDFDYKIVISAGSVLIIILIGIIFCIKRRKQSKTKNEKIEKFADEDVNVDNSAQKKS